MASSDEVRQDCIDTLGEEFGEIYYFLKGSWLQADIEMQEYRELFTNSANIEFMNAIGPKFFRFIQGILFDRIILSICRLTDPAQTGRPQARKHNLSVNQLLEYKKDFPHYSRLSEFVNLTCELAKPARPLRDKIIAHSDLDRIRSDVPLTGMSLNDIDSVLQSVFISLNIVYRQFWPNDELARFRNLDSRCGQFLAYGKQTAEAVLLIDSYIDPGGSAEITDDSVIRGFMYKINANSDRVFDFIEFREAASRFRSSDGM